MTADEITALFGPPERECIENLIGPDHIESAMDEYYTYYRTRHNELAWIYPGMVDVLEFLRRKKVFLGLFTGKGRHTTDIDRHRR